MTHISFANFTWFDYLILIVIGISTIISFFRGFLREAVSFVTWVLAVILALKFSMPLSLKLSGFIHAESLRNVVAFLIIFIAVLLIGFIVNLFLHGFLERTGIGKLDRILGVIFGVFRGILVVSVIILLVRMTALQSALWMRDSQLAPYFNSVVNWLHHYLPTQVNHISNWVGMK